MSSTNKGFEVKGSVCIVTGGCSGIGLALCKHLALEGASKVVVVDLHLEKACEVALALPDGVGIGMEANVGVEMDIRRVIVNTLFKFGQIDAFFANAGIPCNGNACALLSSSLTSPSSWLEPNACCRQMQAVLTSRTRSGTASGRSPTCSSKYYSSRGYYHKATP